MVEAGVRSRGWGGRAAVWMAPIQTMAWSCICLFKLWPGLKRVRWQCDEAHSPVNFRVCLQNMGVAAVQIKAWCEHCVTRDADKHSFAAAVLPEL